MPMSSDTRVDTAATGVATTTAGTTVGTDADLAVHLLRLGDDALVLGQRLCQWITRAPTIEEDLALSNIALDLIGHARTLLTRSGQLDGSGRTEDDLTFTRSEREFTNVLLTELPNEDFAVTVARQLAYTHYAVLYYEALAGCADPELAAFGARAAKEVAFHRMHADRWTLMLGRGTPESTRRMRRGLERVWPYTGELFAEDEVLRRLAASGTVPSPAPLRTEWERRVTGTVADAGLTVPAPTWWAGGGRSGLHTEEFGPLIAELQSVHRQFPGGTW
ncbi:phenylacetate-CoA oxygenase subunit PaaC [Streptomyces sp. LRE541]|uniref:1,2-phenylacetyl-CoA epoxidase subunit PaaC n=1 Tax=Streptomyces sp. LRE541 TaxID=2931983 RepID=UPI00200EA218|nr:1,2-phenylacetyl-CoA epoxidase subunit PaaC [Streptomyces sp. LRE541]UPZ26369.1 phenylacetate-CoA oxygenase subunit PaaC [Streptomyces sp. LRE541]